MAGAKAKRGRKQKASEADGGGDRAEEPQGEGEWEGSSVGPNAARAWDPKLKAVKTA